MVLGFWRDLVWTGIGALLVATAGCSADTGSSGSADPAISVDGILVCGDLDGHGRVTEWYSVPAMTNKLRHFPELARVARVKSVSNCAEARTFFDDYLEYNRTHPGFDEDEPHEPRNLPEPPKPDFVEEPTELTPKILNGTPSRLSPVVGFSNVSGGCTGTFIARNWILTAAHCLAAVPANSAPTVHGYYSTTVTWAGDGGDPTKGPKPHTFQQVLQFWDDRYCGFRLNAPWAPHDVGLLYISKDHDGYLPNDVPDPGSHADSPYLRVSLRSNLPQSNPVIYGWGDTNGTINTRLRSGSVAAYSIQILNGLTQTNDPNKGTTEDLFVALVPVGAPAPCHGDSGGPLVDHYVIDGVSQPVIVAVASGVSPNPTICAGSGSKVAWPRASGAEKLIRDSIALYYPQFSCRSGMTDATVAGGGIKDDFMECWGTRCKIDTDCSNDGYLKCHHAGDQLTAAGQTCAACDSGGGCGCYWGQCLPAQKSQ